MEVGGDSQARGERTPQISDDEDEVIIYCAFSEPEPESDSDTPRPRPDYNKPIPCVPARTVFQDPDGEMNQAMERAHAQAERRLQRQLAAAAEGRVVKRPKITIHRANAGAPRLKGPQIPRLYGSNKRLPDQPSAL